MATTIPAPLAGKTALITGGSRGIGAGIAVDFARKGCVGIAITYASNKTAAESTAAAIRAVNSGITTTIIQADLLSPTFGQDVVTAALAGLQTQRLDIVVANAAVAEPPYLQPVATASKENFEAFMTANVWSTLQLTLSALPHLPTGGRVVILSSATSKRANLDPVILYGCSKAALDSLTRSLALQFAAARKITINAVHVGPTATDALSGAFDALPKSVRDGIVARPSAEKRLGEVRDIVGIVSFLASDDARWINGNLVPANGGAMLELQG